MTTPPPPAPKLHLVALLALAGLAGLSCGYDVGAFGFLLRQLDMLRHLGSPIAPGWISRVVGCSADGEAQALAWISLLITGTAAGNLAGALGCGPLAGWLGRKRTVAAGGLCLALGVGCVALGRGHGLLLAGRILEGVAGGLIMGGLPILLAESLPARLRGTGTMLFQLAVVAGVVASMGAGAWVTPALETAVSLHPEGEGAARSAAWRTLFLAFLPLAAATMLACLPVLESPRWLYLRGRVDRAAGHLRRLRPPAEAEETLQAMAAATGYAPAAGSPMAALRALLSALSTQRHLRRPFLLVLGLFAIQNTIGVGAVLYFPTNLLRQAGMGAETAALGTVWLSLALLAATVANILLVDRAGRQPLLRGGLALCAAALAAAAAIHLAIAHGQLAATPATGMGMLGCLAAFVFGAGIGPFGCLWLLAAELLPTRVRAAGMGCGLVLTIGVNTAMQAAFLPVVGSAGPAALLGAWCACSLGYLAFARFALPETRGRTLEEIEAGFK